MESWGGAAFNAAKMLSGLGIFVAFVGARGSGDDADLLAAQFQAQRIACATIAGLAKGRDMADTFSWV